MRFCLTKTIADRIKEERKREKEQQDDLTNIEIEWIEKKDDQWKKFERSTPMLCAKNTYKSRIGFLFF